MMPIDGVPRGDAFRNLGGRKLPSGGKGKGCAVTLLGMLGGSWLLDLLLAGSRAVA